MSHTTAITEERNMVGDEAPPTFEAPLHAPPLDTLPNMGLHNPNTN